MAQKQLSLRIDEALLEKLRVVAEEQGRSLNGTIQFLIRRHVARFERLHGPLPGGTGPRAGRIE